MSKVVAGFLIAPLVPAAIYGTSSRSLALFLLTALWAYPFALTLGAPAYYFMRKRGWLRLWQVAAASGFLGLLSFAVIWLFSGPDENPSRFLALVAPIFVIFAVLSGITFWAIALRTQPRAP